MQDAPTLKTNHPVLRGIRSCEGTKPKTYDPNRTCEDCGSPLSRYNRGRQCFAHWPFKVPRNRGRQPDQ